jgi:hypothetical protein
MIMAKDEVYELEVMVPLKVKVQLPTNKLETDYVVDRLYQAVRINLPSSGGDPWYFKLAPQRKGSPLPPIGTVLKITQGEF